MHNERDDPWCRYPGIYASMPARSFRRAWQVAGSYRRFNDPAHLVEPSRVRSDPDLLYSFVGSPTHACRKALLDLTGPRSHVEVVEGFLFWDPSSRDFELRRRRFAEILLRSTFVLCPRGNGTASIRLFETLAAGRVPVILADSWVPPAGPDWESFSLRWPEDDAARLPRALEALEAQAGEMGMRARAAYESFFAPDVVLARQLSQLEALVVTARPGRFPSGGYHNAQYLHLRARELRGAARHGAVDIARAGARTPLPRPASHRAGRRSSQPGESVSVPEPDPALRPRRRAVPQIAISSPVRTASAARSVRATSAATVETRIERSSRSDQFST